MYAVFKTGGKQYKVQADEVLDIEKIDGEVGSSVIFDEVMAVGDDGKLETGAPFLDSTTVEGEIIDQFRGNKVTIFKMKRRKGYRRKQGHRQELTKIRIAGIDKK